MLCHFVVIVFKSGRVHVAGNCFGGYYVFRNAIATMVSLAFLVAASAIDRVTIRELGGENVTLQRPTLEPPLVPCPIAGRATTHQGATGVTIQSELTA